MGGTHHQSDRCNYPLLGRGYPGRRKRWIAINGSRRQYQIYAFNYKCRQCGHTWKVRYKGGLITSEKTYVGGDGRDTF